jgi:hypothetical protein
MKSRAAVVSSANDEISSVLLIIEAMGRSNIDDIRGL